jgi:hypothetical protein
MKQREILDRAFDGVTLCLQAFSTAALQGVSGRIMG